jgi:soluble lytic murein transglycosylase-like protein
MNTRQELAVLALGVWLVGTALAESPREAAGKAMAASVARQVAAVTAMRISIAKQRAAVTMGPPAIRDPGEAAETFFTLSWPALGPACDPLPEEQLQPLIEQAAQKEGLEVDLLRAVAEQESGFRACAVSPKGAMGLMQLMPATADELGVHDPFDPQENLQSGAHFLKQLLTRFGGNAALALGAYNAGASRVEEAGGVPEIPETTRYVQQILAKLPLP